MGGWGVGGASVKQTVKFIEQLLLGSRLRNMWRTNEMFVPTDAASPADEQVTRRRGLFH